ncbi:MAG: glycosyltransferase family 4 protein, partial [Planctomycetota bacterium]
AANRCNHQCQRGYGWVVCTLWNQRTVGQRRAVSAATTLACIRKLKTRSNFRSPISSCKSPTALTARRWPTVRWFQSVQTTQPYPRWHWWLQRFAARRAERVICPSRSVADHAASAAGVPHEKLVVLPNGVEQVVSEAQVNEQLPMRVGFLGRLDPVKRVHLLIESTRDLPGVTLDIFGEGPDRARLELLEHGRFHGMVERDQALATLDLLVLPSLAEGMPMVLLEAMAAGVPVVAFDVPGCRDVVCDNVNGRFATPTTLRDVIAELRDDPDQRRHLATGGRATAERHRWPAIAADYAAVLEL